MNNRKSPAFIYEVKSREFNTDILWTPNFLVNVRFTLVKIIFFFLKESALAQRHNGGISEHAIIVCPLTSYLSTKKVSA